MGGGGGPSELNEPPPEAPPKKNTGKKFLKRKKVYDPKEAIKKGVVKRKKFKSAIPEGLLKKRS